MGKNYINSTMGETMFSLLTLKIHFNKIFSKESSKKERKEFVSRITNLT
jgi:hypothetical protein